MLEAKSNQGRKGSADKPLFDEDILDGAEEIAEFVFGDRGKKRWVYLNQDRLPLFRIGLRFCARKSQLRRWFKDQENAGLKTEAA